MTTFTTEDREEVENKVPYPYRQPSAPLIQDENQELLQVLEKIQLEYRIEDSSEDLED